MEESENPEKGSGEFVALLSEAWSAIERRLNGNLGAVRGITYSEYRVLSAIAAGAAIGSSRAELGRAVGLSASAVTRALRPLERLGMVVTAKHERDARLAITRLTADGKELVSDATGVVSDVMADIEDLTPSLKDHRNAILAILAELGRG